LPTQPALYSVATARFGAILIEADSIREARAIARRCDSAPCVCEAQS
jgi:hypothetical protein